MKVITLVVLFGILDKTDKAHISILKIFYKKKVSLIRIVFLNFPYTL